MRITGQQLREARKLAGITQEEMGRRMGVTGKTISNLEKRTAIPQHYYFAAITVVRAEHSSMDVLERAELDLSFSKLGEQSKNEGK